MIYRTEARNGKQDPEFPELETGLGFRGRKEKEIKVPYVHWPEFFCSEEKKSSSKLCPFWTSAALCWVLMSINTQPQAASLGSDRSGEGSGTEL